MSLPDHPMDRAIRPAKQNAKRHYGSHPYFTKRAWNVVQEYIKHFSKPGDTVLDPFGGSGVAAVESLVLRRKAIYVDINPWACFVAKQTARSPASLYDLRSAFRRVEDACGAFIEEIWQVPNDELKGRPVRDWYPKDVRLPENSDVALVEDLFTPRMLHGLARLRFAIASLNDQPSRDLLMMAFSATLVRINRTFLSAANRAESRGGSSVFSIYRYKVAKKTVELPLWPQFVQRFERLLKAKQETNQLIGDFYKENETAVFRQGSATKLLGWIKPGGVDYVYTDPPYGGHISYLDLSTLWTAWLQMPVTPEDSIDEIIEGGAQKKSRGDYQRLLKQALVQMHEVLKTGGWLSIVFAHRDASLWDVLVEACEAAGFAYENTVVQPVGVVWSMHKKKNPLKVLSGELVLNFRKVRRVRQRQRQASGDALTLVRRCCEEVIIQHGGATTERLHHVIVPTLLEAGLLNQFGREHGDIIPILERHFEFVADSRTWQLRNARTLVGEYGRYELVRYFTGLYLKRVAGKSATRDEVQRHLDGLLRDGTLVEASDLEKALSETGTSPDGVHWRRQAGAGQQQALEFKAGGR